MFYAGNILVGKAINDIPPFTITFLRLLIAFLVLFPIGFRSAWKYRKTFIENNKPLFLLTLTGITFFNTFIYGALQFTTSTNVAVLETIIPVMTVLLSAYLLKERLKKIQWTGILLSLIGAVWVVVDGRLLQLATFDWNIGDAIMIGAIVSWAAYSIAVKKFMPLFPPYGAILIMTGISVILLFPVVVLEWTLINVPVLATPNYIVSLLFLGIFPSCIALIFYNRAVELLSASQASVFLNFLPVVTMIGAYLWLGETITLVQIIGAVVVMTGVLLTIQVKGKKQEVSTNVAS